MLATLIVGFIAFALKSEAVNYPYGNTCPGGCRAPRYYQPQEAHPVYYYPGAYQPQQAQPVYHYPGSYQAYPTYRENFYAGCLRGQHRAKNESCITCPQGEFFDGHLRICLPEA